MPNLYADVDMFERRFVNNTTLDPTDAVEVERVLEGASRSIDRYCERIFYALNSTRVLRGIGLDYIPLPDLISATSVKLDEGADGTFEVTLTSPTDYRFERIGADDIDSTPATALRLMAATGQRARFIDQARLVEIVGLWGFSNVLELVQSGGANITGTISGLSTATLATSANGDLSVGQTVLLDSEQIYINGGTGSPPASPWTVDRAVNGTTQAAHTNATLQRYAYVPEVREATLIQAGRIWRRRESAYANVVDNPVSGIQQVWRGLDPDVQQMLNPLRRLRLVA